ncbi:hypothetical protein JH06_1457 [Blastocystis sp. subtype 4]|uniref:hypothetical protein n=1 Tax=Blastocystis sp. subtype 4 TaxID=944170 RepID=UPI000711D34D|nr:hypothetical protein JH06_1457 [Blastocystis sp. subtype 4]KNB45162.1 hypothetical protein JH06_1457 [Blastocystis sp. subtype 4]|eukprot:XP_014528605.1 hypothetical protein JH06_1457 [Blastocystis sp. subtype 4]
MSSLLAHRALCLSKPLFVRSMTNVKSCLDRSEVSERIMNVVKKFDFVDASKVRFAEKRVTPVTHFGSDLGLDSIEIKTVVNAIKAEFCLDGCGCTGSPMSIDEMTACISKNPRAK